MNLKSIFFALIPILFFTACKDNEQVGSSIQPDEDLLQVNSNIIYVESASMLVDSALSKSSYLFLGTYTDSRLGETQAEFMSQIDSRLGVYGITIPDTTVVSTSTTTGINYDILTQINSDYGNITKISSPTEVRADSVFFIIQYSYPNDFLGSPTAAQGVKVYELNKALEPSIIHKYYTNTDVSDSYKKSSLLNMEESGNGYTAEGNNNQIRIRLKDEFGNRLANVYQKGSGINTQADFNNFFKGIYVSHIFNGQSIIKISNAFILLYYSYDADITTTYNGVDVTVNSKDIKTKEGIHLNPLVSSITLSANKAVERVNLFKHAGLKENFSSLQMQNPDVTYAYTPAGMYTAVNIPFKTMVDSIRLKAPDTTKVMFNSARLTLYTKKMDWATELDTTPNTNMLLIHQDSVIPFFHKNKMPDAVSSFVAPYSSKTGSYTFDVTKAVQKKLSGKEVSFSEKMVLVPIVVEQIDNVNYYRQQLWLTATVLYGPKADETKRPRLDMIYTQRK